MDSFIDEKKIMEILEEKKNPAESEIVWVIEKAKQLKGLSLAEAAVLLQAKGKKHEKKMFEAAKEVKERIYGNRLVLFAPLYLSNHCTNNCLYCGFRVDNTELKRKALTTKELKTEVEILLGEGHKRLLLVLGEDYSETDINYLEEAIRTVYSTKKGKGEIRRVNINAAPMPLEDFKRLKKSGIGTYQLFQETYHRETYAKMHPSGPKADYNKRLDVMDVAIAAGIDDVGIGVLFGLYDYKFELLALLAHAKHLDETYGTGPHTISVPRLCPALNAPAANNPPYPVSDDAFKRLVAIIRLAVPYTGMILSTRETPEMRNELFSLGVSQISAASQTNPGGYSEALKNPANESQFSLHDERTTSEVAKDVCAQGFLPSFCTACYRSGRTGEYFMSFAKTGNIQNFCHPNAILTFKEYLLDYAPQKLRKFGEEVISRELSKIPSEERRDETKRKLAELENGKRDEYF